MTHINYTFYTYQWEIDKNSDKLYCYCLDEKSNPTILHIVGYKPPLYITYPNISKYGSLDRLITYLNKILCNQGHDIVYYNSISMKDSTNITNTVNCAMLRFSTWEARRHCYNLLKMRTFNFDNMVVSIINANMDDVVLYLSDNNLDVCGWITVFDLNTTSMLCTKIMSSDRIRPLYPIILSFDIECNSSNTNRMPRSYNLDDKIVMISAVYKRYSFDNNSTVSRAFVLNISNDIYYIRDNIVVCDTEQHMITEFLRYITEIDPVVIVGFNNFGFDISYIIGRLELELMRIPVDISRNKSGTYIRNIESSTKAYGYIKGTSLRCSGRVVMDLLTIFKRDNKLRVRSLDEVSRIFLDDKKMGIGYKEMFNIFNSPTTHGMIQVIDYCIKDSLLVLRLIDKLDMWTTWTEESSITFTNIDDLYTRGVTHRATNMFFRECIRNNILISKHSIERYKTLGGHVFDPIIGLYNNCTCVDYRSLYPSIIIQHNICVSTYIRTSNGQHIFASEPRGIIPNMLISLVSKRNDILLSIKKEQDTRVKSILNARQISLKVSANGIYGVLSTPYEHMLCFSPAAETVTLLGRAYINMLSDILKNRYKFTCVYGDTDSCYITKDSISKRELINETNRAISEINSLLPDNINIAFERHVDSMFIISKKKYVLVADNKMIHKGNVSIRKDNCEFVRRLYAEILDLVLIKRYDKNRIKCYILYEYNRFICGDVDIKDLIITCPVSKSYKSKSNQYYIMIDRLRRNGTNISLNDRIQYLFVKTNNDDCLQGYKMYTYDEVIENGYEIDYRFYIYKKVHKVIGNLLDLLDYSDISVDILSRI